MAGRLPRVSGAVGVIDTTGEGGFYSGTIWAPAGAGTTQTMSSANEVVVYQFPLPFRVVIGRITFNVNTLEAGKVVGVGLYDKDGNRLVHTGAISVAGTGIKSTTVTAVTLEPGIYFHAWTADGTTVAVFAAAAISDGTAGSMSQQGTPAKVGVAANASSTGVLPATLGVVTNSNSFKLPVTYFET